MIFWTGCILFALWNSNFKFASLENYWFLCDCSVEFRVFQFCCVKSLILLAKNMKIKMFLILDSMKQKQSQKTFFWNLILSSMKHKKRKKHKEKTHKIIHILCSWWKGKKTTRNGKVESGKWKWKESESIFHFLYLFGHEFSTIFRVSNYGNLWF